MSNDEIFLEKCEKKEKSHKPCVELSPRRKNLRVSEAKRLIIKIANPESNKKKECVDQCVHVLEDALE